MAQLSKNAFLAKYNDSISGLFKSGQLAGIGSDDHRSLVQDIFDSMPFLTDATDFSVPFTRLFISSGATNWDWVNGYFSLALVEASADFDLNFTNQVLGAQGTIFIKKTVAGDVVVTIPTHQQVGAAGTTTTITLSGDDEQIFRVDFFKSETSSFNQVATTVVAFTKVQHLSSTVVLGFAGTTLYKSTDSGNTWSLAYTSPDDTIVDFDFDGVNGVLVSRVANGGNFDFNIFTSSNSGDTWSVYSVGSTLDLRNQDHVQKVIYYSAGEYYTFGQTSVPDYRRITYRITSNTASSDQGNLVCMQIGNISRLSTDVWAVATRNDRIESFIIKRTGTNTWSEALDSPQINLSIRGIDFATPSLGIAVGNDSANDPAIIKSVDGGATWTTKTIDTNIGILREVAAVSTTSFIVIGDNGIGYSTDSGETWTYFATPNGGDALSAWDSDDIIIASSTLIFKGFGSTIGDIFQLHSLGGSTDLNDTDVRYFDQEDFIAASSVWSPSSNGAGAASGYGTYGYDTTENALGVISIFTGTTTTGRTTLLYNSVSSGIAFGLGHTVKIRFRAAIDALSDGTDTFTAYIGFIDNVGAGDQVDGCYFRYTHGTNGGRWEAVNSANNVRTAVDTTVSAGITYSIFEITINAGGTSVSFSVNGTTVLNTSNIPTGSSRLTKPGAKIEKSVGTTSRTFYIDWYDLLITRTTAR